MKLLRKIKEWFGEFMGPLDALEPRDGEDRDECPRCGVSCYWPSEEFDGVSYYITRVCDACGWESEYADWA